MIQLICRRYYKKLLVHIVLFSQIVFLPFSLISCPCGCDASSSLILDNYQMQKYSLQFSHELNPKVVLRNKKIISNASPISSIQTLRFSGISRGFWGVNFFANVSIKKNNYLTKTNYGLGDPLIGIQAELLESNKILVPQVYFSLGLKFPLAKSYLDKDSNYKMVEVHGNGLWELRPQIDIAWNIEEWAIVLSDIYVFKKNYSKRENIISGDVNRLRAQGSYTFMGTAQIWAALEQEFRMSDEDSRGNRLFSNSFIYKGEIAGNVKIGLKKSISISYTMMLPYFNNPSYTSAIYDQVSLSYHLSV
jgi:hypothetical protein